MELQVEVKKQYRSTEAWIEQILNIFSSVLWFLGTGIAMSVIMVGIVCIAFVLTYNGNNFTFSDIQNGFRMIVSYCCIVSVLFVGVFGLPRKLRNIFHEIAWDRIQRHNAIEREIDSQVQTADGLLLRYGLITQDDIEARKKGAVESK